jgi:hypothetical protein
MAKKKVTKKKAELKTAFVVVIEDCMNFCGAFKTYEEAEDFCKERIELKGFEDEYLLIMEVVKTTRAVGIMEDIHTELETAKLEELLDM